MVFSSNPLYLDTPNWQQHSNEQEFLQGHDDSNNKNHQGRLLPPDHALVALGGGGGGGGPLPLTIHQRHSMVEKVPAALGLEGPLKCPRCSSTNTKFCYYNNYNRSQPRHFCKACRRYWTSGGALRNVPVGGGCRKNKRNNNKSSASSASATTNSGSLSKIPRSRAFMESLQNMTSQLGLNFGGSNSNSLLMNSNYDQISSISSSSNMLNQENGNYHDQFPNFLGGFEIPIPIPVGAMDDDDNEQLVEKSTTNNLNINMMMMSMGNPNSHMGPLMKMELDHHNNNIRQPPPPPPASLFMGISTNARMNAATSTTENKNNNINQIWGISNNNNTSNNMWNSTSTTTTSHLM